MQIIALSGLFFVFIISAFPGHTNVLSAQNSPQAPEQNSQETEKWGNWVYPKELKWALFDTKKIFYRVVKNRNVFHAIFYVERTTIDPSGQQTTQGACIFFLWRDEQRTWYKFLSPNKEPFQEQPMLPLVFKIMAEGAIAAIAVENETIWFAPDHKDEIEHLLKEVPIWFNNTRKEI